MISRIPLSIRETDHRQTVTQMDQAQLHSHAGTLQNILLLVGDVCQHTPIPILPYAVIVRELNSDRVPKFCGCPKVVVILGFGVRDHMFQDLFDVLSWHVILETTNKYNACAGDPIGALAAKVCWDIRTHVKRPHRLSKPTPEPLGQIVFWHCRSCFAQGWAATLATLFLSDRVCGLIEARPPNAQDITLRVRLWRTRNMLLYVALVACIIKKRRYGAQGRLRIPVKA